MANPLLDTSSLPRFDDITPEHVLPAIETLIASNRRKLEALLDDAGNDDFDAIVTPVEAMDHELSRVWSPVRHLQSVLGSRDWRDAYNSALPLLTEYGTELSQNTHLQQAFARVSQALDHKASAASRSVVDHALRDFHLAGVDLPDAEKERFKGIMQELAAIQARFEHNVQDCSDAWILHIEDEQELAGLPDQAKQRASEEARTRELSGWVLTLDYPTFDAIMTHVSNRALRERFYRAWSTRASDQAGDGEWDNSENIEKILALRHEASNLVGFDSYAEYSLATKMAGTSDEVISFLRELAERTRDVARREIGQLADLAGVEIRPWDTAYWLERYKQHEYSISNEELRQYFPQRTAIRGLFDLAERLYGVRLTEEPDVPTWHETISYYVLHSGDGERLGGFYTDLFARPGKRSGAWIDECITRKDLNGHAVLPVGYLVCNFPPPDNNGVSLITHDDLVTLFHEFGHMLHHLLTRIDYPSIAGINGVPWDAVELPSQFMENFAWSFEVLTRCSAHVETGEPLPRDVFDRLEAARHAGEAMAMMRQIEFALLDFRLHAEFDPDRGSRLEDFIAEVRNEVSLLQHPDYNRFAHSFSHIFAGGYAAGYYSYKWAEVLAADAFEAFLEAGIFDRDIATRFRSEILEIGGSRDIMDAYVAFRGRKPDIGALLRLSGIESQ